MSRFLYLANIARRIMRAIGLMRMAAMPVLVAVSITVSIAISTAVSIAVSIDYAQPAIAFKTFKYVGGAIHQEISREALVNSSIGLNEKAFALVSKANTGQDEPPNIFIDSHHFDNCKFDESKAFIDKCYSEIAHDAAKAVNDKVKRENILKSFGALLHPIQDFYSHANYIELKLKEDSSLTPETIPLVKWSEVKNSAITATTPSVRTGFFTTLEVTGSRSLAIARLKSQKLKVKDSDYLDTAKYNKLQTLDERIDFATNAKLSLLHSDLNKDDGQTDEGKVVSKVTKKSLYEYARALAVRETQRQWQRLDTTVRAASGADADRLISQLKDGR